MKKSDFTVLQEMSDNNEDISCATTLVSVDLCKQGGRVTMGVDKSCFYKIMNDEVILVLYAVNRKQFNERKK